MTDNGGLRPVSMKGEITMTKAEERLQTIEARVKKLIAECEKEIEENAALARQAKRDYWKLVAAGEEAASVYDVAIGFEQEVEDARQRLCELEYILY